jgi:hypothetical protein
VGICMVWLMLLASLTPFHFLQLPTIVAISHSGSDLEGIEETRSEGHVFRGPPYGPMLLFSASRGAESDFLVACGTFLYETVMLLWLRAWLDHIEDGIEGEGSGTVDSKITSFVIPPENARSNRDQPVFSFFANMDFLLLPSV